MLQGYKTYFPLLLIAIHQVMKWLNVDVFTDEQLSTFVDIFLTILAALFKLMSNIREKHQLKHISALELQVKELKK